MRVFLAFLVCLGLAFPAQARLKTGPIDAGSGHRIKSGTVVDTMRTSLAAVYSFRWVVPTYAGPALKLRRATGGTLDVGFTASGDFDLAAATAFCLATSCFVDTWYDQTGLGRHAVQATTANQPAYIADCGGGLPCAQITTTTQRLDSPSITWTSATQTMSAVGNRAVGTGRCYFMGKTGGYFATLPAAANTWDVTDFATEFFMAAADNAWHAGIAIFSGASSLGRIDATEMPGVSVAGSAAASGLFIATGEGASTTCREREAIIWNNYALTLAERTALTQNQRDYFMPLPLDSFSTPKAAYSLRKLRSAYTGNAVRLRRASGGEQDIGFLGFVPGLGSPIDVAAAFAFCASTDCYLAKWYDQSGSSLDLLQATPANQPLLVFNCLGTLPCARTTASTQAMVNDTVGAGTVMTLNAVARHTVRNAPGSAYCGYLQAGQQFIQQHSDFDLFWLAANGGGTLSVTVAALQWHSHTGVINGAGTVARIDATETGGTTVTGQGGGWVYFYGGTPQTCDQAEMVWWDGYAMPQAERAALNTNQKSFWGF